MSLLYHHKERIKESFLLAALLALVFLFNGKDLLLANRCVFLGSAHCEALMGEGLDLLFISWCDRAEIVNSLIAEERVGLLLKFCPYELSFSGLVYKLDVDLFIDYLLPYF